MNLKALFLSALLLPALAIGHAAAAQTQTLHGTVVNYLSAIGASNGGALASHPGTGGITVNSHNAGIYTHGPSRLVQPLGIQANGHVYLLFVHNGHANIVDKLASKSGQGVTVKGHTVTRDGAEVFVVDSIG